MKYYIGIDLGGTNEKRSKIAIASPTSSLIIQADQSKLSKTGDGLTINDKEHASAALIFGSVGTNNINVLILIFTQIIQQLKH